MSEVPLYRSRACRARTRMGEHSRLVEQQPPQGVFVCDHAGLVINKFSYQASYTSVHVEPSLDASSLRSDVISSMKIHLFVVQASGMPGATAYSSAAHVLRDICIYIYIYIYICIYVCVCVYMCIYIYIYIVASLAGVGHAGGDCVHIRGARAARHARRAGPARCAIFENCRHFLS